MKLEDLKDIDAVLSLLLLKDMTNFNDVNIPSLRHVIEKEIEEAEYGWQPMFKALGGRWPTLAEAQTNLTAEELVANEKAGDPLNILFENN